MRANRSKATEVPDPSSVRQKIIAQRYLTIARMRGRDVIGSSENIAPAIIHGAKRTTRGRKGIATLRLLDDLNSR